MQIKLQGFDRAWGLLPEWHNRPPADLPRIEPGGVYALDFECYDPMLKTHGPGWCFTDRPGHILGAAVCTGDGNSWYYPMRHPSGNLPAERMERWIRDLAACSGATVHMFSALYDLGWARRLGIREWKSKVVDSAIMAPLLDEYMQRYNLDAVAKRWLPDEAGKVDLGKGGVAQAVEFAPEYVGDYAAQDARLTMFLGLKLERLIARDNLDDIHKLEHELLWPLLDMRENGVRVDIERAERLHAEYEAEEHTLLLGLQRQLGFIVQPWRQDHLRRVCALTGLDTPDSFDDLWFAGLDHPIWATLRRIRKINRARRTFIRSYILDRAVRGRIHAVFSALRSEEGGTVSGRFSSSNPNLQNIPARDPEIGKAIRALFLPEVDQLWASTDFRSQEPRLSVHYSALLKCRGVEPFIQGYLEDPNMDFHQRGAEITGIPRKLAKNLTLGKMYRMGGVKLCKSLHLPTRIIEVQRGSVVTRKEVPGEEGQTMLDQYNRYMPFVDQVNKICEEAAERRGYIRTLLGRLCRFANDGSKGRHADPYKAFNRLIQSSAADMMKRAMVDVHKVLPKHSSKLLVTVHDELGTSVPDKEAATALASVMNSCVTLLVPVSSDIELGPNWGELS